MSFVDIHISPVVLDKRTSDKCAATHFSQKHSKTTDMIFVRILLCISLLRCISLSAGVNIVTATFRVRGKHHGKDRIRKCAMKVLQNVSLLRTYLKQVMLNISVRYQNVLVYISCDLGINYWTYLNFLNILIVSLSTFHR
jgi:hypothetical protein